LYIHFAGQHQAIIFHDTKIIAFGTTQSSPPIMISSIHGLTLDNVKYNSGFKSKRRMQQDGQKPGFLASYSVMGVNWKSEMQVWPGQSRAEKVRISG
jgi:hypothetical protein